MRGPIGPSGTRGAPAPRRLALTRLRALTLNRPSGPGRPAHLTAASGLVRRGDHLYAVSDEELHLASFRLEGHAPGALHRVFSGELPAKNPPRKEHKPDLESLALLPGSKRFPHGALLGMGSGSTARRERGFLWELDAQGALRGSPRQVDLSPLFGRLRQALPELNLEGAAWLGERLVLLARANQGAGRNCLVELDGPGCLFALGEGQPLEAKLLRGVREVDLGTLEGVRLGFTDASPLPDGRLVFTAAAEGTPDAYQDGLFVGATVGVLSPEGEVLGQWRVAPAAKLEGVHAEPAGRDVRLWLTSDADDPEVPSPLFTAVLRDGGAG